MSYIPGTGLISGETGGDLTTNVSITVDHDGIVQNKNDISVLKTEVQNLEDTVDGYTDSGGNFVKGNSEKITDLDTKIDSLTTTDIIEGNNKYYTIDRFDARLSIKTTDDLTEGTNNLYYNDTRFDTRFNNKTTDDITEGTTNLYYTDERVQSKLDTLNIPNQINTNIDNIISLSQTVDGYTDSSDEYQKGLKDIIVGIGDVNANNFDVGLAQLVLGYTAITPGEEEDDEDISTDVKGILELNTEIIALHAKDAAQDESAAWTLATAFIYEAAQFAYARAKNKGTFTNRFEAPSRNYSLTFAHLVGDNLSLVQEHLNAFNSAFNYNDNANETDVDFKDNAALFRTIQPNIKLYISGKTEGVESFDGYTVTKPIRPVVINKKLWICDYNDDTATFPYEHQSGISKTDRDKTNLFVQGESRFVGDIYIKNNVSHDNTWRLLNDELFKGVVPQSVLSLDNSPDNLTEHRKLRFNANPKHFTELPNEANNQKELVLNFKTNSANKNISGLQTVNNLEINTDDSLNIVVPTTGSAENQKNGQLQVKLRNNQLAGSEKQSALHIDEGLAINFNPQHFEIPTVSPNFNQLCLKLRNDTDGTKNQSGLSQNNDGLFINHTSQFEVSSTTTDINFNKLSLELNTTGNIQNSTTGLKVKDNVYHPKITNLINTVSTSATTNSQISFNTAKTQLTFTEGGKSKSYRDDALSYRNTAKEYRDSAKDYKDNAFTYKNDAKGFQDNAFTYKNQALTYKGEAFSSAGAAATSAAEASASAGIASTAAAVSTGSAGLSALVSIGTALFNNGGEANVNIVPIVAPLQIQTNETTEEGAIGLNINAYELKINEFNLSLHDNYSSLIDWTPPTNTETGLKVNLKGKSGEGVVDVLGNATLDGGNQFDDDLIGTLPDSYESIWKYDDTVGGTNGEANGNQFKRRIHYDTTGIFDADPKHLSIGFYTAITTFQLNRNNHYLPAGGGGHEVFFNTANTQHQDYNDDGDNGIVIKFQTGRDGPVKVKCDIKFVNSDGNNDSTTLDADDWYLKSTDFIGTNSLELDDNIVEDIYNHYYFGFSILSAQIRVLFYLNGQLFAKGIKTFGGSSFRNTKYHIFGGYNIAHSGLLRTPLTGQFWSGNASDIKIYNKFLVNEPDTLDSISTEYINGDDPDKPKIFADRIKLNTSHFSVNSDKKLEINSSFVGYSLPIASATVLGGVKQGTNINIDANGVISSTDTNTTYTAGTNINIDANNVISATNTTYTAGTNINIDANGVISSTDTVYTLPIASATVLGGVKQGTNINIDANGVISSSGVSTWTDLSGKPFNSINTNTLEIDGNGQLNVIGGGGGGGTSVFTESGNNIYYNGGNVGIGTTNPTTHKLSIYQNDSSGWNSTTKIASWYSAFGIENQGGAGVGMSFKNNQETGYIYYGNSSSWVGQGAFGIATTSTNQENDLKLVIKNNGNVGIGTTNPEYKLHVANLNLINSQQDLLIIESHTAVPEGGNSILFRNRWDNGAYWNMARITAVEQSGYGGQLIFQTNVGSGSADDTTVEAMRINEYGNVGIGNNNPTELLTIGNLAYQEGIRNLVRFNTKRHNDGFTIRNNDNIYNANLEFIYTYNNVSCLSLHHTGRVGIGTTNPYYKLDFGNNGTGGTSSDYGGMLSVYNNNGNYLYGIDADNYGSGYGLNFYASAGGKAEGNIRMKIDRNTGNVGIGTTNPGYKLDVRGNMRLGDGTTGEQDIIYQNNTGTWQVGLNNSGNGTSSNQFYIYDNAYRLTVQKGTGNVGIGTTNPYSKLHLEGDMRVNNGALRLRNDNAGIITLADQFTRFWWVNQGTTILYGYGSVISPVFQVRDQYNITVMQLSGSAGLFVNGLSITSDSRIKKNIRDIDDNEALNKILLIQPKKYEYADINRKQETVIGFIAQQVYEVLPEAVDICKDFIPNIQEHFSCTSNIIRMPNTNDIEIGTKIKVRYQVKKEVENIYSSNLDTSNIYSSNLEDEDTAEYIDKGDDYVISKIFDDYVELDRDLPDTSNCYVYGTEVDDFHRLKKDRIFSLNVSATQELYKIIQNQQTTINDLISRIELIESLTES